jgi:lipopolysaccharide export system permease protein
MAFAILGAPRTTRQNRNFAIRLLVLGITHSSHRRASGLSTVSTSAIRCDTRSVRMLAAVSAASVWAIVRGIIIDAPANLLRRVNNLFARVITSAAVVWRSVWTGLSSCL